MLRLLRVLVRHVQAHVVEPVNLHLLVDGARHDVARSQREAPVVLLHKLLTVGQAQNAAVAAHGLGDEVGGVRLAGMIEGRGVKLYELHVLHRGLGAVGHGYAVARGDVGVRRGGIHGAAAPRGQHRHAR